MQIFFFKINVCAKKSLAHEENEQKLEKANTLITVQFEAFNTLFPYWSMIHNVIVRTEDSLNKDIFKLEPYWIE